jgi:hypothetical protein
MTKWTRGWRLAAGLTTLLLGAPAAAQLAGLPLPGLPVASELTRGVAETLTSAGRLTGERVERLMQLVRANRQALDIDDSGAPIVRGEVLAVSPTPATLDAARAAGFEVRRSERLEALDLTLVTLAVPEGLSARRALKRLRQLDPQGRFDVNHIYGGAGTAAAAAVGRTPVRVGLIDSGVAASHPSLAGVRVEQRGFAPGGIAPQMHGTSVASLLTGPGGTLFAADVYGTGPTGGSAATVARALAWMADEQVGVVNVSLVGPPNATLAATVKALHARGHLIVAAVGNDGPAAKPLYPASYPEVIAVTGVDARHKLLLEASRSPSLDFAAPGVGLVRGARGTSFAAPIVAAWLAAKLPRPDRASAARATDALRRVAVDLGRPGYDSVYGHGFVGDEPRVAIAAENRERRD